MFIQASVRCIEEYSYVKRINNLPYNRLYLNSVTVTKKLEVQGFVGGDGVEWGWEEGEGHQTKS
jgi:hypothetical protein